MKTDSMQKMLEKLFAAGQIESGKQYNLMPSDCSGDGYDIALRPRCDESGDYVVSGHLLRVTNTIRVGSHNWADGVPCRYTVECDPATPYILKPGERAEVVHRRGSNIGRSGFMSRVMASIAIIRHDGRKVYNGHTPYWLGSTSTYASHYKTGMSRRDDDAYGIQVAQLQAVCDQINATSGVASDKSSCVLYKPRET